MLHIIAAFSEFERALIRERTVAGLEHARVEAIRRLRSEGCSYREIQKRLGAPVGVVAAALSGVDGARKSPSPAVWNSSISSGLEKDKKRRS